MGTGSGHPYDTLMLSVIGRCLSPFFHKRSAVLFPNGIKDVDDPGRPIQVDDSMAHVSGDAIEIACLESLLLIADEEKQPPLEDHADLLVRMGMIVHNRVRLQVDDRDHYLLGRACLNMHAGEDGMPSAFFE